MDDADIRAFVTRDWDTIASGKSRFWAERKRTLCPAEAMALADELRRYAQSIRPDWPDLADRVADLEAHRRVSEALRACVHHGPR